jgi:tRNA uridine 5-carboxymethylaminomethyl modification enzyme
MQKEILASSENLIVYEGSVRDLYVEGNTCLGVHLSNGETLTSDAVVLTTGTFLGGICHIGAGFKMPAGRFMRGLKNGKFEGFDSLTAEPPSSELAVSLRKKFPLGRLRTGTPPRIARDSIDYSALEAQECDANPKWFSFEHEFHGFRMHSAPITCHMA